MDQDSTKPSPGGDNQGPLPALPDSPVNHLERLPTELLQLIVVKVPPSDVAGSLKSVSSEMAALTRGYRHVRIKAIKDWPRAALIAARNDDQPWAGFTDIERQHIMRMTAFSGDLDCMEVVLKRCGRSADGSVMQDHCVLVAAAGAGHVHICAQLLRAGWGTSVADLAAACKVAAAAGHVPVLQLLTSEACLPSEDAHKQFSVWRAAAFAAVEGGQVHVVAWLHGECGFPNVLPPASLPAAAAVAAVAAEQQQQQQQQRRDYSHHNSSSITMQLALLAASGGHVQMLELMMPALERAFQEAVGALVPPAFVAEGALDNELLAKRAYDGPLGLLERVCGLLPHAADADD
ncbi:hypothetical protein HXX76_002435 [Chlamydomonas incerta]|uniref:F-box domain-containing protein n=1 Tax=Chlamydomonas incerta TaxID=51695 RepID=A0A835W921_CHLIN|nr:hypothetical protein HXX76_002435 [Chlamydomonas incerta]|eukprot:KAG2442349.1 hypothetical protein HXX76_002435 [Chlamydomonas incerta]